MARGEGGGGVRGAVTEDVSETAASLHICGDDLDPDEVARLIGGPSECGRRKSFTDMTS